MGAQRVSPGHRRGDEPDWWTQPIPGDVSRADLAGNEDLCALGFGDPDECESGGSSTDVVIGMQPAIVGTFLTVLGASLLAIPLGVMGAVYLNEYGKNGRLARFIRFMTDVMTGVPSVVMGVFIYSIWVLPRGLDGRSAWAASLALACLMLPIVVRSTEEMLKLVPDSLREASAALGTRTWKTTVKVVLPSAVAGITSGSLLAVARAAGETAPVVFVIGFVTTTNLSLMGPNTTLSAQIYSQQQNGGPLATQLAWGAAVTLVALVVVLTLVARTISRRFEIRHEEGPDGTVTEPEAEEPPMATPEQRPDDVTRGVTAGLPRPTVPSAISVHPLGATGAHDDPALGDDDFQSRPVVFDVHDLNVHYGSHKAVRNVDMQVRRNEITAFIGPSGCGKTTVLRCFNRMNDLIEAPASTA